MTTCDVCGATADIEILAQYRALTPHGEQELRSTAGELVRYVCVRCGKEAGAIVDEVAERRSKAPERAKA
jgi:hypothetical protein